MWTSRESLGSHVFSPSLVGNIVLVEMDKIGGKSGDSMWKWDYDFHHYRVDLSLSSAALFSEHPSTFLEGAIPVSDMP